MLLHALNASSIQIHIILRILGCGSWWTITGFGYTNNWDSPESHAWIMWISNNNRKIGRCGEKNNNNKQLQGHFLLKNAPLPPPPKKKKLRARDGFMHIHSFVSMLIEAMRWSSSVSCLLTCARMVTIIWPMNT